MSEREVDTYRSEDTVPPLRSRRIVLKGVLPGDTACVAVAPGSVVLGRAEECDIVLEHPRVSRRHAELRSQGPLPCLFDLDSTNGTYVDGTRVSRSVLEPGMLVRIGDWLALVDEIDPNVTEAPFGECAPGLWGGPLLANTLAPLLDAARSDLPIVLVGATGTGKERFARALHAASGRSGAFVALNCAALPEALAESELFGHCKGAFTGAERAHTGRLRAAHGGTLLLDEIAELPLRLQAKLLRAIELKEVTPLGQSETISFDARVVAACQRPIGQLVALATFREDLAMRLAGLTVELPPLRERREDIPGLFWNFIRENAPLRPPAISTRLYEALCLYDWPGNVRELELLARRLLATLASEPVLRRSHLPPNILDAAEPESPAAEPVRAGLEELTKALATTHGNVRHAAALVGMSRQRAYRLIASRRIGSVVAAARDSARWKPDDRSDRDS
jgi:hypothetical protein